MSKNMLNILISKIYKSNSLLKFMNVCVNYQEQLKVKVLKNVYLDDESFVYLYYEVYLNKIKCISDENKMGNIFEFLDSLEMLKLYI